MVINLQQRRQEYTMGNKQSPQQMVLGKLDSYMQNNETNSKWIKDLKVRPETK